MVRGELYRIGETRESLTIERTGLGLGLGRAGEAELNPAIKADVIPIEFTALNQGQETKPAKRAALAPQESSVVLDIVPSGDGDEGVETEDAAKLSLVFPEGSGNSVNA